MHSRTPQQRLVIAAGLVYIRIDNNALSIGPRLSTIFFMVLLNALTPISYMAFYVADRRFFQMDSDNGLYAPSAYYMAAVSAGAHPASKVLQCPKHLMLTEAFCILHACKSNCTSRFL